MRATAMLVGLTLFAGCGEGESPPSDSPLDPEHCRLPLVRRLPPGDPDDNQWWLSGPLDVGTTVAWPDCPPLDASTATTDETRITFPAASNGVADGEWPVIVFGHGNNGVCNPTDRYRSLHEQWASWGWIVVSVDASEQNCTPWTLAGMKTRVDNFDVALEDLRARNADPGSPFYQRVRFDQNITAGHSRGGAAAIALASRGPAWHGAMSLQGANPSRFRLGNTYVDVPVIGVSSELDNDLRFPHVELTETLLRGRYSWHTLRRANHPYTGDGLPKQKADDPDVILPRAVQIELTKFLTVAFLASNFGVWDGRTFQRRPQADPILYSSLGEEFALDHLRGDGFVSRWDRGPEHRAIWIDRYDSRIVDEERDDEPYRLDPELNELGLPNRCDGLARCEEFWTYALDGEDDERAGYRLASSRILAASGSVGTFGTTLDLDVTAGWRLQGRVRAPTNETATFAVIIAGDDGERRIDGIDVGDRYTQLDVALEERHVDEVRFELTTGSLQLDDLRLVAPNPDATP